MRIVSLATMQTVSHSTFLPPIAQSGETAIRSNTCNAVPAATRAWMTIAILGLVIAGMLSLLVVVGRIPGIRLFPNDPLFFQRCLVVHVVLSLIVWFYAFIAGLSTLTSPDSPSLQHRFAAALGAGGIALMIVGAFMPNAQPILANYIPVIDHPAFLLGISLFFASIIIFLGRFLCQSTTTGQSFLPAETTIGLRTAAIAVFIAAATWIAAYAGLPAGVDRLMFFEFSAWGAGHVLQVANVCAMLAVWLWLIRHSRGTPLLTPRTTALLFALLILPHFAAPLLTLRGSLNHLYIHGSTQLMRWAIFPVVSVVIILTLRHLWVHRHAPSTIRSRALTAGLMGSIGLTTLGFILGAMIRSSSTLIPAHYHASLGGVTVAFMAAAYLIAARRPGLSPSFWSLARFQLITFGIGQVIFVAGFAIGGLYGLGRKSYASEQYLLGPGEYVGLAIMGIGGLLAAVGGLLFLFLILRELRHWWIPKK